MPYKLGTTDLNVPICNWLNTILWYPDSYTPYGGITVSGTIDPAINENLQGAIILEKAVVRLWWKDANGNSLTSNDYEAELYVENGKVCFKKYVEQLPLYDRVAYLHVHLIMTLIKNGLPYYTNIIYPTGVFWPKPLGNPYLTLNQRIYDTVGVKLCLPFPDSSIWMDFIVTDTNGNVYRNRTVNSLPDPYSNSYQIFNLPRDREFIIKARTRNLVEASPFSELFVPKFSVVDESCIRKFNLSIDEVPSKPFHHLIIDYEIQDPGGVEITKKEFILYKDQRELERHSFSSMSGTYRFDYLQDTPEGNRYMVSIKIYYKSQGVDLTFATSRNITGGFIDGNT